MPGGLKIRCGRAVMCFARPVMGRATFCFLVKARPVFHLLLKKIMQRGGGGVEFVGCD